uniref:SpoIIIAH-like family protein n=1 Tax=Candidatus Fimivicinus sp. TaxID=3056640 RepID=UPI003FF0EDB4
FVNWYYTKPDAEKANTGVTVSEQATQAAGNLGDALLVNSSTASSKDDTQESKAEQAQAKVEDEYFAQARLNRSTAHDKAAEELKKTIEDSKASSEAVKTATQELGELSKAIKLEADTENLINAKIGSPCVVVIGNKTAQVVVGKGVLKDDVLVQIKEIVLKQTGFSVENVTIMEAK